MISRIGTAGVASTLLLFSTTSLYSHPDNLSDEELKQNCQWDRFIEVMDESTPPSDELYDADGNWTLTHMFNHCRKYWTQEDLLMEANCENLVGNYKNSLGSTWKIRLNDSGEQIACEKGLGQARAKSVEFKANELTIEWCTGQYAGYYKWDMDGSCTKGAGQVVHQEGPMKGTKKKSEIERTASPFGDLEPCPDKLFEDSYCKTD